MLRFIFLAALFASSTTRAQQQGGDTTFRADVNEVIVPVTVTDDKGRFVPDLQAKDFKIFEENKRQEIRFFARDRSQPVVAGFLLDLSTASRVHWENIQNAAVELMQSLLAGGRGYSGYLIGYAADAEVAVDTTSESDPLVEKVRKLRPGGGAALYDAIYLACTNRKLVKGEPLEPRRVIVVIGDGHDNASRHSLAQVLEVAERSQVTIYAVSTKTTDFNDKNDEILQKMAVQTGGRVVYPLGDVYRDTDGYLSKPSGDGNYALSAKGGAYETAIDAKLNRAVNDIAGEVTTQYIIRYISDNPKDKTYRRLKVVVDLDRVRVRARKGYYAGTPSS